MLRSFASFSEDVSGFLQMTMAAAAATTMTRRVAVSANIVVVLLILLFLGHVNLCTCLGRRGVVRDVHFSVGRQSCGFKLLQLCQGDDLWAQTSDGIINSHVFADAIR